MLRSCAVSLLVGLVSTWALSARAAAASVPPNPLPIALELSGCEAIDQVDLLKLLSMEFQTLNVQATAPLERVRIVCSSNLARVTTDAGATVNEVQLAETASAAWPRLLALSVSEIVIESRARVALPVPHSEPRVLPVLAPKSRSSPRPMRKWRLSAGAALRRAVRPATWLAGPDVGLQLDLTSHFSLASDVRAEWGSTDTDVAKVHWTSLRAALMGLVGSHFGPLQLAIGPSVCLGYLRLSPTVSVANATGHSVSGVWGGPALVARAGYDVSPDWSLAATLDAGVVTWPVAGLVNGERRLIDSGGGWVSGALTLGTIF